MAAARVAVVVGLAASCALAARVRPDIMDEIHDEIAEAHANDTMQDHPEALLETEASWGSRRRAPAAQQQQPVTRCLNGNPDGAPRVCSSQHDFQCGIIDGKAVTCNPGRFCSKFCWCGHEHEYESTKQDYFSDNQGGACQAPTPAPTAPEPAPEPTPAPEALTPAPTPAPTTPEPAPEPTPAPEVAEDEPDAAVGSTPFTLMQGRRCVYWSDEGLASNRGGPCTTFRAETAGEGLSHFVTAEGQCLGTMAAAGDSKDSVSGPMAAACDAENFVATWVEHNEKWCNGDQENAGSWCLTKQDA